MTTQPSSEIEKLMKEDNLDVANIFNKIASETVRLKEKTLKEQRFNAIGKDIERLQKELLSEAHNAALDGKFFIEFVRRRLDGYNDNRSFEAIEKGYKIDWDDITKFFEKKKFTVSKAKDNTGLVKAIHISW